MKNISIFALLSALVLPAFATETPDTTVDNSALMPETAIVSVDNNSSFLHGVQFGLGISGSSGLNGFIGYANKDFDSFWAKRFGVRFDFGTTAPMKTQINEAINEVLGDRIEIGDNLAISDMSIKSHHYAALVDFYPFGDIWFFGGLRLTGGYYMGEFNATASIAGTINELDGGSYEFELMGNHFKYTGNSVHGTATLDWDYRGPYLGTGFDIGLFAGFKVYMDAGIIFTNKSAQLGLNVPFDNLTMNGNPVDNDTIKETVDGVIDETLADAQSELDDMKFYPMVKVGFMYRF